MNICLFVLLNVNGIKKNINTTQTIHQMPFPSYITLWSYTYHLTNDVSVALEWTSSRLSNSF